MNDKKNAAPAKETALKQIRDECMGTDCRSQGNRLLTALHSFPVTTYEAMRHLDVYHVPARVLQLRKAGHNIITHWQTVVTEANVRHRVGLYVLQRGGDHA